MGNPECIMRTPFRMGLRRLGASIAFLGFLNAAQAAVDISDQPTKHMRCSAGVCSPTATKAVLNAGQVVHLLRNGDLTLTTGNGAVVILVSAALTWSGAHRLTLDANCNVGIRAPVTVAGPGALTIVTNDGGSGCDLVFRPGGKIDFWDLSSSLTIDGNSYTLVDDIAGLAEGISANPSGFYALANNYDAHQDGRYAGAPIATGFEGTLEGLGHEIDDLTIDDENTSASDGLFATLDASGTVRDIGLVNLRLKARGIAAGGLVGTSSGTIANSSVTGGSQGTVPVALGGLVGRNMGLVRNSVAAGTIASEGCSATCFPVVGGLVAVNTGTISLSRATSDVMVSFARRHAEAAPHAGGLAGENYGSIAQSFAAGSITTARGNDQSSVLGGLVGLNEGEIDDGYAVGDATLGSGAQFGQAKVGGLVGWNNSTGGVAASFSTGDVDGAAGFSDGSTGGLIGRDSASGGISTSYWDLDTSGIANKSQGAGDPSNDPGITGLTTIQMTQGLPAGFDPAIWGQDPSINNGYPYLLANPPPK
jgi:hypothetical protein